MTYKEQIDLWKKRFGNKLNTMYIMQRNGVLDLVSKEKKRVDQRLRGGWTIYQTPVEPVEAKKIDDHVSVESTDGEVLESEEVVTPKRRNRKTKKVKN